MGAWYEEKLVPMKRADSNVGQNYRVDDIKGASVMYSAKLSCEWNNGYIDPKSRATVAATAREDATRSMLALVEDVSDSECDSDEQVGEIGGARSDGSLRRSVAVVSQLHDISMAFGHVST